MREFFRGLPGLLLLLLLVLQFVTGLLLSLYHLPHPERAFEGLFFLRTRIFWGPEIHSLHHWGAVLLLPLAFLHGLQLLWERGYLRNRWQWIIGGLFFFLLLNQDLSGRLLPYSQRAYWEVTRSLEALGRIPLWGNLILFLTQAREGITTLTYIRFYAFHVAWVPLLLILLGGVHLWTTARQGPREGLPPIRWRPPFFLGLAELALLTFAAVLTLAVLFPPEHGLRVDPVNPYPGASPTWYLRPFLRLSHWLPWNLGPLLLATLVASVLFVPWVDQGKRPWVRFWGLGVAVLYLLLSLGGAP